MTKLAKCRARLLVCKKARSQHSQSRFAKSLCVLLPEPGGLEAPLAHVKLNGGGYALNVVSSGRLRQRPTTDEELWS